MGHHKSQATEKGWPGCIYRYPRYRAYQLNGDLGIQMGDPVTLLFALVFSIQIVLTGRYASPWIRLP